MISAALLVMLCHFGIFWRYTAQKTLANPPKISNGLFVPIECPRNIDVISGINMDKRLNIRNPINIILYLGYVFLTLNSCFFSHFFPRDLGYAEHWDVSSWSYEKKLENGGFNGKTIGKP